MSNVVQLFASSGDDETDECVPSFPLADEAATMRERANRIYSRHLVERGFSKGDVDGDGLTASERGGHAKASAAGKSPTVIASEVGTTRQAVDSVVSELRRRGGVITRAAHPGFQAEKLVKTPIASTAGFVVTREDPILDALRVRRAELVAAHEAKLAGIDAAIKALGGDGLR